jgi:hypothetical protein
MRGPTYKDKMREAGVGGVGETAAQSDDSLSLAGNNKKLIPWVFQRRFAPIGESVIFEVQQEERLLEAERRAQEAERQRVEAEQVLQQSQRNNEETGVLLAGRFGAARIGGGGGGRSMWITG